VTEPDLVPAEYVERRILSIRGQNVIIDADLAELYGVETRALNQAVRRNIDRFPEDFAFRLSSEEFKNLRSQTVIPSWGGRRTPPYAFTEHGAIMIANVLRSRRAIEMSVFVVRAFVRLRGILSSQIEMLRKLEELEDRVGEHDEALRSIVQTIRRLMAPLPTTPKIGFEADKEDGRADRG
jgi:phage regulator Rha-like protein